MPTASQRYRAIPIASDRAAVTSGQEFEGSRRSYKRAGLALLFALGNWKNKARRSAKSNIWMIVLISFSFTASGCIGPFSSKFDPSRTVDAEQKIAADPKYKEVDDLCKEIQLPPDSKFVGKARLFNRFGIMNFYRTSRPPDEIDRHFRELLSVGEWAVIKESPVDFLEFKKGAFEVHIQIGGIAPDITYSVACIGARR